jgi:PPM family protein phosphatase
MLETAHSAASAPGAGHDRVAVVQAPCGPVLIVADGSGGTSGAAEAAECAIRELTDATKAADASDPAHWVATLERTDAAIAGRRGQCALVVAAVAGNRIVGASVGDCCAWLLRSAAIDDLTERQVRKPLLGSGHALPVGFTGTLAGSTLLLASDGLWKYVPRERIAAIARTQDLQEAARQLAAEPRLRSGQLPDDVAVVLCRERNSSADSVT